MSGPEKLNPALIQPGQVTRPDPPPSPAERLQPADSSSGGFQDLLERELALKRANLTLSGHALQRLQRRGITPHPAQIERLGEGVNIAASKGSRSALVVVDNLFFVVGVPNRTVITAIDREHMNKQVFTNIDTAVMA